MLRGCCEELPGAYTTHRHSSCSVVGSAWDLLTFRDRMGLLWDLVVLSCLPIAYARRVLGLNHLPLGRTSDATTEVRGHPLEQQSLI